MTCPKAQRSLTSPWRRSPQIHPAQHLWRRPSRHPLQPAAPVKAERRSNQNRPTTAAKLPLKQRQPTIPHSHSRRHRRRQPSRMESRGTMPRRRRARSSTARGCRRRRLPGRRLRAGPAVRQCRARIALLLLRRWESSQVRPQAFLRRRFVVRTVCSPLQQINAPGYPFHAAAADSRRCCCYLHA